MYPEARWGEFDPNLLAGAKAARERYSVKDVVEAQAVRREVAVAWNLFFEKYDFLLTPTVGVQPFPVLKNAPDGLDGKPNIAWSPYTATFNLTRHPPPRCRAASAAPACRSACRSSPAISRTPRCSRSPVPMPTPSAQIPRAAGDQAMTADLAMMPAHQLVKLYKARKASPVER
jgi:hypothetical protein